MTKVCTVCKIEKPYSDYAKKTNSVFGIRSECKECAKQYQERVKDKRKEWGINYYEQNKDAINLTTKKCREKRIEENIAREREMYRRAYHRNKDYYKKRYELNRELFLIKNKDWRATDKGKASSVNSEARRRARVPTSDKIRLLPVVMQLRSSSHCFYCEGETDKVHIDHYIPLSKGGKHEESNLVASCPSCNLKKHNKMPDQLIKEIKNVFKF